jgi:hypothetical protein
VEHNLHFAGTILSIIGQFYAWYHLIHGRSVEALYWALFAIWTLFGTRL